ncbi:ROK family transcriptional regulator [Streptomyces liliiviolaceus]|uniref:ROK family transcriptional regulator n=1 Tax=Streptomyces liliiviolaceus TaxID=2823109 RepID=UPI001FFDE01F|nr:ROK family protein [Streptomyces liliiviolaceus]
MSDARTYPVLRRPQRNDFDEPAHGQHADQVVRLLRRFGPLTRSELGKLCGLSRTTLYEVVSKLVDAGTIVATVPDNASRGRGRPAEKLELNPAAGCVLGIDFGHQSIRVAALVPARREIRTVVETHLATASWPERMSLARQLARAAVGGQLGQRSFDAVGVSLPRSQSVLSAQADQRAVTKMISRSFGARVRLDSAVRLAALAEASWGAAEGQKEVLYLELSNRVGGGLISSGSLHRGAYGRSGEFGHIVVEPQGAPCSCGGRGCLQTVASSGAVLEAYGAATDVAGLESALRSGAERAREAVERAGTHAGRALAGLVNALEPGIVVVGGALTSIESPLMERLERELRAHVVQCSWRPPLVLRTATLGTAAAALGAVSLALSHPDTASARSLGRRPNPSVQPGRTGPMSAAPGPELSLAALLAGRPVGDGMHYGDGPTVPANQRDVLPSTYTTPTM